MAALAESQGQETVVVPKLVYDVECRCADCRTGADDDAGTLERVARWLEGRALGCHPGSEQTFFYREIARDIRDGRIDR